MNYSSENETLEKGLFFILALPTGPINQGELKDMIEKMNC